MTAENTLDLRGERLDDAIRETDKFIDLALQRGWRNAFFIHGHGTGVLREGLRRHFDECPYVARWKAAERGQGGDGVSVIWLAD
jgi:DNA mismatch repair protein MutS2